MDNNKHNLHDKIINAINSGKVTMRPRWHFALQGALALIGSVLLALSLLFLVSLIIFSLRRSGAWFGPGFGGRGALELLYSLPWLLVGFSLFFIIILEILFQKYSTAYRRPLLYSAIAVLSLAIVGGFAVALTPLHQNLFQQARTHRLPFGEGIYGHMPRPDRLIAGEVLEITNPDFLIATDHNENFSVIISPQTRFLPDANIKTGDSVVVLGGRDNGKIHAEAVRNVTGQPAFPRRPMMGRGMGW